MNEMASYDLETFLNYVVAVLELQEIPHMVVGEFAAIAYGVPRSTVDVDLVVDIRAEHIRPFVTAFPDSHYYRSEDGTRDSLARRNPFNIIEMATAAKVDVVPLPDDVFSRMAFGRRQRIEYVEGHSATFVTPEDVIVAKLQAHKNTGSDKHLRDALGVLTIHWGDLNLDLIRRACRASEISDAFEMIMEAARREVEDVQ
ncbi:MAG: hypothetical protein PVH17_03860 [Anaerolineae bacterium]